VVLDTSGSMAIVLGPYRSSRSSSLQLGGAWRATLGMPRWVLPYSRS